MDIQYKNIISLIISFGEFKSFKLQKIIFNRITRQLNDILKEVWCLDDNICDYDYIHSVLLELKDGSNIYPFICWAPNFNSLELTMHSDPWKNYESTGRIIIDNKELFADLIEMYLDNILLLNAKFHEYIRKEYSECMCYIFKLLYINLYFICFNFK